MPIDTRTLAAMSIRTAGIPEHITCRRCGYTLGGLKPGGVCPECALPIERSLARGGDLDTAAPGLVRSMARGALIVEIASAIAGLQLLWSIGGLTRLGELELFREIEAGASCAYALLALFGWWMLSARDEGARHDPSRATRAALRALLIAGLLASGALGALAVAAEQVTIDPMLIISASFSEGAVTMSAFIAGMLLLESLALRIPDPSTEIRAHALVRFGVAILSVLLGFGGFFALIGLTGSPMMIPSGCALVVLPPIYLFWAALYFHVMHTARRSLARAAERAAVSAGA